MAITQTDKGVHFDTDRDMRKWFKSLKRPTALERVWYMIEDMPSWPRDAYMECKYAYQRVRYGLSDRDTWNLNSHMALIMARGLRHLETRGHGFPGHQGWSYSRWQAALRRHANAFEVYHKKDLSVDNMTVRQNAKFEAAKQFVKDMWEHLWW
jgi:hypothetical protein